MSRFNDRLALAALALLLMPGPAMAQKQILADRPLTMETLLDRIQIEDFLTRYYYDLAVGKAHELAEYFTEDAVLDVDGVVAKGHAEIAPACRVQQRSSGRRAVLTSLPSGTIHSPERYSAHGSN